MADPLASSPHLLGSGTLHHLFTSNVDSSREAIQADLAGKILYDQPTVFTRLRVDEHDQHFVTNCAESLKADYADNIALLKELAAQASKKLPDELEKEEKDDAANDPGKDSKSGNHGSAEEKLMYAPLVQTFLDDIFFLPLNILLQVRLFNHITQFGQTNGLRKFERMNGILKADEHHTFGFPSVSPDITISLEGVDAASSKKWRDRDAFGNVKPSNRQGPKPATTGTIPPVVTQCADYARLFMSARPFMLFCVGILIFGTEFCVGIFDRDGVTFSPTYDMFKNTDILVRVVRSLACKLSINELGLDPTVQVLTDEETKKLTNQTAKNIYPSALVSCGGRQWCTIGSPIWSSLSFLGRGTNVWRVRECVLDNNQHPHLQGDVMIMKTAWRSSARIPESDIYLSIPNPYPEGLAKFKCGGDVKFPLTGFPITVRNLRDQIHQDLSPTISTPVLHRLILLTVGRPMWQYVSEYDLLTGFRDAIRAHKALCDMHILHRDISAGNVLLTETHNGGFITDLELACIQDPTIQRRQVADVINFIPPSRIPVEVTKPTHTTFESTVKVKRGAGMTGTAQFMAMAILLGKGVVHEATHDVESFIWVFSYCVMRNLLHRASKHPQQEVKNQCKEFRNLFSAAFAQTTLKKIEAARGHKSAALKFPEDEYVNRIIESFMSESLVNLFLDFQRLIYRAENPDDPAHLTHGKLLEMVDNAVESLQ